VIHFCQRYHLGPYFFDKYSLPANFLSCEHPLAKVPSSGDSSSCVDELLREGYDYALLPSDDADRDPNAVRIAVGETARPRHAYMLCQLLHGLNEVATHYKQHHCSGSGTNVSYAKTFVWPHTIPNSTGER